MKKTLTIFAGLIFTISALFAQVDAATVEKGFKLLESTDDTLAYHGDYSATISLVIEKPGKPKENIQFKIYERTDKDLMTIVQIFPEADKGKGYLRDGDNIWSYDPISRKFTHTSIKEALGDSDVKIDDINYSLSFNINIVNNLKAFICKERRIYSSIRNKFAN